MSVLRKRGKEELRFKIMNNRVSNPIFKNLKGLAIKSLNENPDIEEKLDRHYKAIQICFFYEAKDPNVVSSLHQILKDPEIGGIPSTDSALTLSRKNIGCILIFVKRLYEITQTRTHIENVEEYHKLVLFEELCHLVEQKGDSRNRLQSFRELRSLYLKNNLLGCGTEIMKNLDSDRNHYEVFSMMLKAYPDLWVSVWWKYYSCTQEQFRQHYEQWKKDTSNNVACARLIEAFLMNLSFLYVAKKAEEEKLSEKNRKLLTILIDAGKTDVQSKRELIEKDMGTTALNLIDGINEQAFQTPDIFFSRILNLWNNLKIV
jgi:hypothetical protein